MRLYCAAKWSAPPGSLHESNRMFLSRLANDLEVQETRLNSLSSRCPIQLRVLGINSSRLGPFTNGCTKSFIAGGRSCTSTAKHWSVRSRASADWLPHLTSGRLPAARTSFTGPSVQWNGTCPSRRKYRHKPHAQMSTRSFQQRPSKSSGAEKVCVPRLVSIALLAAPPPMIFALLKSVTFSLMPDSDSSLPAMRQFSGFTSL
mmetsp:Transcript_9567/g.24636  ORF Transcript_9567/g.24636 Transcript_9567/m.24636 type:complete len:203 (-) Transcript_9567:684-1292(-)